MARSVSAARGKTVGSSSDRSVILLAIDQGFRTARTLIRCGAVVFCIWLGGNIVAPLAGHSTAVSLAISILADLKMAVAITLAGATTAWALVERALRYRKTTYLQGRIQQLELERDPNRSSSGLDPSGKTNPRDRGV